MKIGIMNGPPLSEGVRAWVKVVGGHPQGSSCPHPPSLTVIPAGAEEPLVFTAEKRLSGGTHLHATPYNQSL
jgi:hypothetical protein